MTDEIVPHSLSYECTAGGWTIKVFDQYNNLIASKNVNAEGLSFYKECPDANFNKALKQWPDLVSAIEELEYACISLELRGIINDLSRSDEYGEDYDRWDEEE